MARARSAGPALHKSREAEYREIELPHSDRSKTPIEPYLELLPSFDTLLIMTIKAGFGGQRFIPGLLEKVRTARRHADAGHLHLRLEVDGGVAADTIAQAAEAGADAFVAGTAVYGAGDPAAAIAELRRLAERPNR